eukprot:TRINITY_DN103209_c0_g1_i1.p1 TRINITY_DN103209_c0_g1~~TRINITY_DN103209_c0_g1_i1.p1  ORF type:complete len:165 (-),score=6.84 TRINITY_DN103209_c0_g1_i1:154-648(-)
MKTRRKPRQRRRRRPASAPLSRSRSPRSNSSRRSSTPRSLPVWKRLYHLADNLNINTPEKEAKKAAGPHVRQLQQLQKEIQAVAENLEKGSQKMENDEYILPTGWTPPRLQVGRMLSPKKAPSAPSPPTSPAAATLREAAFGEIKPITMPSPTKKVRVVAPHKW